MKPMVSQGKKEGIASAILQKCIGTHGVWADPTRYRFQCWTRDFVIAIMPALFEIGRSDVARTHLENLSKRQKPNGQIPILFLDRAMPFIVDKTIKSIRDRKLSFMLGRFLQGQLWNLTPGTRDSEILYLMGMHEYAHHTSDRSLLLKYAEQVALATEYVEKQLTDNWLVLGCDWRDTMHKELGDKALLTNNSLLYRAYRLMNSKARASILYDRINDSFWENGSYLEYPGAKRFDPLGGAFAVLYDVVPSARYRSVIASFRSVDTPCGVAIKCRHNPISAEESEVIERTDGVVVWPFVVGFSVLALLKMGERAMAEQQFEKLLALEGFREWYDPETGKGYGAMEQLWSATLFLRAAAAIRS
jgi:hypothetical protein